MAQADQRHGGPFGRLVTGHSWFVVAVWVVILGACAMVVPTLQSQLGSPDYGVDSAESTEVQSKIGQYFPSNGSEQDLVVFDSADLTVDDPDFRDVVTRSVTSLQSMPDISSVVSPFGGLSTQQISPDRHSAIAIVALSGDAHDLSTVSDDVQTQMAGLRTDSVSVELTGYSPIARDSTEIETFDLERAEAIGIPIALIVLVLALGSIVSATIPLVSALAALLTSFGVIFALSTVLRFDSIVVTIATMIGTGVGIDYALFIVTRFREELSVDGAPPSRLESQRASAVAVGTVGRTIVASGLIVIVSLCSLVVIRAPIFREVALSVAITVVCTMAVGLTLLPAILTLLGSRVAAGSLPARWQPVRTGDARGRWSRWAYLVMRRPIVFGGAAVAILLLAAIPLARVEYGIDIGISSIAETPSGHAASIVADRFAPGLLAPIQIVATDPGDMPLSAENAATAGQFANMLSSNPSVATAFTQNNGGRLLVTAIASIPIDSADSTALVTDLRERAQVVGSDGGPQILVGGVTAGFVDLSAEVTSKLLSVVLLVLGSSFLFLLFVFRSLALSVKAVLMNILSTGAALGITVAVFQWGWGASLLDFKSRGFLQVYLPVTVFAVIFGLSMDYEVFLIRRMREHWDNTADNRAAVAHGIEHTGRPITAAAAIMVAIFGSFVTADFVELKQFGVALSAAIALDALLIRMVLVPALMRFFGRWNWWLPWARTSAQR